MKFNYDMYKFKLKYQGLEFFKYDIDLTEILYYPPYEISVAFYYKWTPENACCDDVQIKHTMVLVNIMLKRIWRFFISFNKKQVADLKNELELCSKLIVSRCNFSLKS